ncbi:MAG: hypothetical protein WBX01_12820 [Nitrososphaeraceae archaeon]
MLAGYDDSSERLKQILEENRIEISPAAHVYSLEKAAQAQGNKVPPSLYATLDEFDYYNTELGLNIILADGYKLSRCDCRDTLFRCRTLLHYSKLNYRV